MLQQGVPILRADVGRRDQRVLRTAALLDSSALEWALAPEDILLPDEDVDMEAEITIEIIDVLSLILK